MKKIFTPLSALLICISGSVFGQNTVLNNFETISPPVVSRYGLTSTFSIVSNPNTIGNTTVSCAKIGRTTTNWYELFAFNTSFSVPANTTKYLHVLVNYQAQPDISIRFDADDASKDGATDIRPLNKYTNLGNWQDLVFKIDGGASGISVKSIVFLPDLGFENTPAQLVLNNTDKFGYIDEFVVNDNATPISLSVNTLQKNSSIAMYPNPTSDQLTITNVLAGSVVSINSIDGKNVYTSTNSNNENVNLSVKGWAKGVYLMRVNNQSESIVKKIIID